MRGQSVHAYGFGGGRPASGACQCVCLCVRVVDGAEGVQVQGALKDQQVAAVACGEEFTVAITAERGVFVWGLNNVGQLGGATQKAVAESPIHLAALRDRQVRALPLLHVLHHASAHPRHARARCSCTHQWAFRV